jgi:hypothetical protein
MRYSDVDTTYLYTATQRIAAGLASATSLSTNIYPNPVQSPDAPFWAVDVIDFDLQEMSEQLHVQTWTVASYLVYTPPPESRSDSVYPTMWSALPQAFVYMQGHKRLMFSTSDTAIKYLQTQDVRVAMQRINEGQPGFAITHTLPFLIALQQE